MSRAWLALSQIPVERGNFPFSLMTNLSTRHIREMSLYAPGQPDFDLGRCPGRACIKAALCERV
jgi:hypothetical protein